MHPTPIYETVLYTLTFLILWRMRRKPHPDGTILAWYLILSATFRFGVECLRIEPVVAFGLTSAQMMGLLLVPLGMALLLWTRRGWQTAAA